MTESEDRTARASARSSGVRCRETSRYFAHSIIRHLIYPRVGIRCTHRAAREQRSGHLTAVRASAMYLRRSLIDVHSPPLYSIYSLWCLSLGHEPKQSYHLSLRQPVAASELQLLRKPAGLQELSTAPVFRSFDMTLQILRLLQD